MPPYTPARSFGVTDLLADTWKVTVRIALPAAPLLLVLMALQLWMVRNVFVASADSFSWWSLGVVTVLGIPMGVLAYGTLLRLALDGFDGRPDLRAALRVALARFFPLLGLDLALTLVIGLGTWCCFVPGIFLAVSLAEALPAMVDEQVGPIEALRNAWARIDGYRWVFLAADLVLGAVILAVGVSGSCLIGLVAGIVGGLGGGLDAEGLGMRFGETAVDAYFVLGIPLSLSWHAMFASLHRRIQPSRGEAAVVGALTAPAATQGATPSP